MELTILPQSGSSEDPLEGSSDISSSKELVVHSPTETSEETSCDTSWETAGEATTGITEEEQDQPLPESDLPVEEFIKLYDNRVKSSRDDYDKARDTVTEPLGQDLQDIANRHYRPKFQEEAAEEAVLDEIRGSLKRSATGSLHREILKWKYFQRNSPVKLPGKLPASFTTMKEYSKMLIPFVLEEAWCSIVSYRESTDKNKTPMRQCAISGHPDINEHGKMTVTLAITQGSGVFQQYELNKETVVVLGQKAYGSDIDPAGETALGVIMRSKSSEGDGHQTNVVIELNTNNWIGRNKFVYFRSVCNMTSVTRELTALACISTYDCGSSILQGEVSIIDDSPQVENFYKSRMNLTDAQAQAVSRCAHGYGFQLIQGPPGTGKTKTIVDIIVSLVSQKRRTGGKSKSILLCAPSNAAVNEIAARLAEKNHTDFQNETFSMNVVRIAPMEKTSENIRHLTLNARIMDMALKNLKDDDVLVVMKLLEQVEKRVKMLKDIYSSKTLRRMDTDDLTAEYVPRNEQILRGEIRQLYSKFKEMESKLIFKYEVLAPEILRDADVVCTTLSHSISDKVVAAKPQFDTIIIDEAAQATEPSTIIPLQYKHKRCIMVGDPKQLPPTILSTRSSNLNYDQSLFNRLYYKNQSYFGSHTLLDSQFRMHPHISKFPAIEFYENRLKNAIPDVQHFSRPWHQDYEALGPFSFFDVKGCQKPANKSQMNEFEAICVVRLLKFLRQKYGNEFTIGVVTPYKGQVMLISDIINAQASLKSNISVGSIDGFQGQEKDIIIFTCVRSFTEYSPNNNIGFLRDVRRLNVAITRAKSSLWMLGNTSVLRTHKTWSKLIDEAMDRNAFYRVNESSIVSLIERNGPPKSNRIMASPSSLIGLVQDLDIGK